MKIKSVRRIAAFMAVAMMVTMIPDVSFAAENVFLGIKTSSAMKSIKESFLDAADGGVLINDESYFISYEERNPQKIKGYTYEDYTEEIEKIYAHRDLNYIIGYPDNTVRTERYLSRAEAVTIFYRLYDGNFPERKRNFSSGVFSDVGRSDWYYDEVKTMYEIGLIDGNGGQFRPNQPVTRAEITKMSVNFNPSQFKVKEQYLFNDVSANAWYYNTVAVAQANGWIKGFNDGTFRPENLITRVETMTIVNRVINRSVTMKQLEKLKVECPYSDIDTDYWGYVDVMEATVRHTAEKWHGYNYNDGEYDVIVEKYVDENGKEIAETEVSKGKPETSAKNLRDIPAYDYIGYVRNITYNYNSGDARPAVRKTASVRTASVGDVVTYSVVMTNDEKAGSPWKNVKMTDAIPQEMEFIDNSVYLNNRNVSYELKNGVISVAVGDIEEGKSSEVTFRAKIKEGCEGKTIYNTAVAAGDNGKASGGNEVDGRYSATDDGVTVKDGYTAPYVVKKADRKIAAPGDLVTFTVNAGNGKAASRIRNAVISDVIPVGLTFHGNVLVDGKSAEYEFDKEIGILTVRLGDMESGEVKMISYETVVDDGTYGMKIENLATMTGDNIEPEQGITSVDIRDGKAELHINKSADSDNASVGDSLTYEITVSNSKNAEVSAKNVFLTDVLPEGFSLEDVTVNGYANQPYMYDAKTRTLKLDLADIAPAESVVVEISGVVNSTAYGKTIENTAFAESDNAGKVKDSAEVAVSEGSPDGHVSEKYPDRKYVKTGETLTYTVSLTNSDKATAVWQNAKITDNIPEGMTFAGNVHKDGTITGNYAYDSKNKILTLIPGDIEIGGKVEFTFDVTINEGTEGEIITNTAVLDDGNGNESPIPSPPVVVDMGTPMISAVKTASIDGKEIDRIDLAEKNTFTYTVKLRNKKADSSAMWKSVYCVDVMPAGVDLASAVTVNGYPVLTFSEGNSVYFKIGNIPADEEYVIQYDVMVKDTVKDGDTITNTITAHGDNGFTGARNSIKAIRKPAAENPYAEKSVSRTEVDLSSKDTSVVYTVKLTNSTDKTWKNVKVVDRLNDTLMRFYDDSVRLNGILTKSYSIDENYVLTVPVGDVEPGKTAEISFKVDFKKEAQDMIFTNLAVAVSDNFDNQEAKAESVSITGTPPPETTSEHVQLFSGSFSKIDNSLMFAGINYDTDYYGASEGILSLGDVTASLLRSLSLKERNALIEPYGGYSALVSIKDLPDRETVTINGRQMAVMAPVWTNSDVGKFLRLCRLYSENECRLTGFENRGLLKYNTYTAQGIDELAVSCAASRADIGKLLDFMGIKRLSGYDYVSTNVVTSRIEWCKEICSIFGRDINPDTNGCQLRVYSDASYFAKDKGVVDEVSNHHVYTVNEKGHETWLATRNSTQAYKYFAEN